MGDAEYLAAFDRVLLPAAREFAPEIVLVSAGFDAAEGDPLGAMRLTPAGYAQMTARLATLAGGRLVLALEGGYDLEAIAKSAAACLRVLLGEAPPARESGAPSCRGVGDPGCRQRSAAICRSWYRESVSCAVSEPTRAKNMSHCVSQGSPCVPRNASAAPPVASAVHHSTNS